jgi:hypothetical protein
MGPTHPNLGFMGPTHLLPCMQWLMPLCAELPLQLHGLPWPLLIAKSLYEGEKLRFNFCFLNGDSGLLGDPRCTRENFGPLSSHFILLAIGIYAKFVSNLSLGFSKSNSCLICNFTSKVMHFEWSNIVSGNACIRSIGAFKTSISFNVCFFVVLNFLIWKPNPWFPHRDRYGCHHNGVTNNPHLMLEICYK